MKNAILNVYRCIVGTERGLTGEGSQQWYYFLSLVTNLMLIWWLNPEIALLFTTLSVIHYLTVFLYGYFDLDCESVIFSYVYLAIHCILLILAIFASLKWSIIIIMVTVVLVLLAPDCAGDDILLPLLFNTIIFVAFIVIDFLLPIELLIKLLLIVEILLIHPLIDLLEDDCVIVSDVTDDVFYNIKKSFRKPKNH